MQKLVESWANKLLGWMGLSPDQSAGIDHWVIFGIIVILAVLCDLFCRLVLMRIVHRVVLHTKATWDDVVFNPVVMRRLCHIITPVLIFILLPLAFPPESGILPVVMRLMQVLIVVVIFRFVSAVIHVAFELVAIRPAWQGKPIKGLRQTGQGIAMLIAVILIVSILIGRSPGIVLTGLGASAAIIMLVFRDSILGFVSGIQLSVNDMLKVGDWIAMPKYGADGTVIEVSLTTVKIRNWDNTIVTLPPYLLVSDSFQNWEAMRASGGRRVKRAINLDMTSVRFCTEEMLAKYRSIDLLHDYITQTEARVEAYNTDRGVTPGSWAGNGLRQTNLGVFRAYLTEYLRKEARVNKAMTLMVRQLQPAETGVPMELYFFTDTVDWVAYEGIQADVFDHVLAVIPEFDLRVFQNPSGNDVARLTRQHSSL